MGDILVAVHDWLRWLILLVGVLGLVLSSSSWSKGVESRLAVILSAVFMGILDLQLILGLGILATDKEAREGGWIHAVVMLGAVLGAHYFRLRYRRLREHERRRYLVGVFFFPLLLIVAGLAALP